LEDPSARAGPNLNDLTERIKSSLLSNPGKVFPNSSKESTLPRASVALILKPEPEKNELLLLLIKRKARDGDPWSGHMAFPGGRYAENDKNLLATAIREVMEETNIDLREFSILGALDEIVSGGFAIRVTPYVALSRGKVSVRIDPREVDDSVWMPISFFLDEKNSKPYRVTRLGQTIEVPCFVYRESFVIWGMTLRIIGDLTSRVRR
jgi:8-oxo-dGTP pyrophosphatase MutT (NUDIX family)